MKQEASPRKTLWDFQYEETMDWDRAVLTRHGLLEPYHDTLIQDATDWLAAHTTQDDLSEDEEFTTHGVIQVGGFIEPIVLPYPDAGFP